LPGTTGQELLQGLERAANAVGIKAARGFKRGTLPWGLIRSVGWVYPSWRELARMSYLWRMPHALDGSRLAARVALPPATPLDMALHESLVKLPNLTGQASTAQV
jgi:hypothetical protein